MAQQADRGLHGGTRLSFLAFAPEFPRIAFSNYPQRVGDSDVIGGLQE